ncbi:hypothetical protein ACTXT7_008921 [Hymenolepis weldensis]
MSQNKFGGKRTLEPNGKISVVTLPQDLPDKPSYINSTLNPLIYAIFNREFRRPFWELLICHCLNINARLRERRYQHEYQPPPVSFPMISSGGNACPTISETPNLPRCRNSTYLMERRRSSIMTE